MSGPINGGRSRAIQALRESEELHRLVLSNVSDAVFLTDGDGRFTFICPNVDVIFGYQPDEVQEMERIDGLLGGNLYDPARLAASGEITNIEREIINKAGDRRTVLVTVKQVSINGGRVLFACRDVTDRKSAEDEVRFTRSELTHATRLTLVGEMSASIAHELAQPLSAISTSAATGARLIDEQRRDPAMLRDLFHEIGRQSEFAGDVIQRLRALSRKQALRLEPLGVNAVLQDLLKLMAPEARRRAVTLRADFEPGLLPVYADRVSLSQIVINLVLNAMDAVSQSPERLVTLRTRQLPEAAEISVVDTGPGIQSDHLPRLFDPFFTTKREGVGLGLAITRSLIDTLGGLISVVDHAGEGATFLVVLPSYSGAGTDAAPGPAQPA